MAKSAEDPKQGSAQG
jgi:hypothetical protein